jgi:peptide/nickel transport system permease protein
MTLGFALLAEGALAFLGLSVRPPETSLGSMLRRGFGAVNETPRLVLVPGLAITVLTLAFNAVADGLRDAMTRSVDDRVDQIDQDERVDQVDHLDGIEGRL